MAGSEEVLAAFPGGVSRTQVTPTTQFRSTWLSSSLRSIRERNLLESYLAHLPREHHDAVLSTVVGVWLPAEIAVAHYAACDRLGLTEQEQVAIGAEVGRHAQGTVLSVAVSLAKGAGVTPWTIMTRFPSAWQRIWKGGGISVIKLAPKDARIEIAGWPCARVPYARVALRGVISGLVELFCEKAYARELRALCTQMTLAYRVSWA